jgi:hypothetical protein
MKDKSQFYEKPIEYVYYVYETVIYPFELILCEIAREESHKKYVYTVRRKSHKKYIHNRNRKHRK